MLTSYNSTILTYPDIDCVFLNAGMTVTSDTKTATLGEVRAVKAGVLNSQSSCRHLPRDSDTRLGAHLQLVGNHLTTANGHPPVLSLCSLSAVFAASPYPLPTKLNGPTSFTLKPSGAIPSSPGNGAPINLLTHAPGPHRFINVGLTYIGKVSYLQNVHLPSSSAVLLTSRDFMKCGLGSARCLSRNLLNPKNPDRSCGY